ncbi:MAG: TonB-dependent receptor, partial [Gemmatimonadaceae bacterium]
MLRMILFVMCLGSAAGAIGAQELALSARGPRFLVASGRGRVVEIEPATAPVFQRRVTLALEHTTVGEALAALGREAGIRLVYSRDVLDADAPTRIKVEGITVAAALTEILFGAGVDVVLSDVNRVTLAPRQLPRRPPAGVVRGTVVDSASRVPIAGAQLAVVGTAARAVTGTDGQFTLPNVPAGEWTLQARRVGYRAAERSVRVEDGQTLSVDFALSQAASMLDEVIVAGSFLESSRREAPVPVTVLSEEEIHRPTRNRIDQLFRGDIPGVVGYDNGSFALGTAAFVRGSASLDDSNLLKVYVDGIETPANLLTSSIDLSSIERVELLRGPQASTIYGSNASGGVLLLFTKNGRRGGPHLS